MAIRLVALDLDRTLLGFDGKVGAANRQAVRWAQSRGVVVTLATSRRFPAAVPLATELSIKAPLITFGGGYVAKPDRSTVYLERRLSHEVAHDVLGLAWEHGYPVMAYTVTDLFAVEREAVLASGYWRPDDVQEWTPALGNSSSYLQLVSVGESPVQAIGGYLKRKFAGHFRYDVFTQHGDWTGHLLHPASSKGQALAELAAQLGIDRAEVLAMGDECSDVDMVEWAGVGIAMSWSIPEVLAVADDVTDKDDPDGVATMLYRYLEQE